MGRCRELCELRWAVHREREASLKVLGCYPPRSFSLRSVSGNLTPISWVFGCHATQPLAAGRYMLRLLLGACSAAEVAACALLLEPRGGGCRRTLGALATVLAVESVYHLEAAATRQLPPVIRRFTAPATLGVKLVRVGEHPPESSRLRGLRCRWRLEYVGHWELTVRCWVRGLPGPGAQRYGVRRE